jgi:hypothetical protein
MSGVQGAAPPTGQDLRWHFRSPAPAARIRAAASEQPIRTATERERQADRFLTVAVRICRVPWPSASRPCKAGRTPNMGAHWVHPVWGGMGPPSADLPVLDDSTGKLALADDAQRPIAALRDFRATPSSTRRCVGQVEPCDTCRWPVSSPGDGGSGHATDGTGGQLRKAGGALRSAEGGPSRLPSHGRSRASTCPTADFNDHPVSFGQPSGDGNRASRPQALTAP